MPTTRDGRDGGEVTRGRAERGMLRKIVHGDRRDGADDRLGAGPAGGKNLLPRTPLIYNTLQYFVIL